MGSHPGTATRSDWRGSLVFGCFGIRLLLLPVSSGLGAQPRSFATGVQETRSASRSMGRLRRCLIRAICLGGLWRAPLALVLAGRSPGAAWTAVHEQPGSSRYRRPRGHRLAVLKYRLYDIDVVINRTLVYGPPTVSLALLYFVSIVVPRGPFALTGQERPSSLSWPRRWPSRRFQALRRIQILIDRRFYRGKYDAAKTLEAFGASLREEIDLGGPNGQLVAVVEQTMRPAHVSLWLQREEGGEEGKYWMHRDR